MTNQKRLERLRDFAAAMDDRFMGDEIEWLCSKFDKSFLGKEADSEIEDVRDQLSDVESSLDDVRIALRDLERAISRQRAA